MVRLAAEIPEMAHWVNTALPIVTLAFGLLGYFLNPWFHIGTLFFGVLTCYNFYLRHVVVRHPLLRNFGIMAHVRYILETIGPEMRQYWFSGDEDEKPFNRVQRSEVYRKAKNEDSAQSFGSLNQFDNTELKIRHSLYPVDKPDLEKYSLTLGEERGLKTAYTLHKPVIISAMSYGALGENAVRALARGAKKAGIPMNTGEGGYPKYHLKEGCDLIFQLGTAKFGVRNEDGTLNDKKLSDLASKEQVKMIEIKFSQGAKPGKGGLLPKEKITEEISQLRGVPMGKDVVSPPHHKECTDPTSTVKFIKHVQDVSGLPVGIKMCIGKTTEFQELVKEMKKQKVFPDYISIDGAEGGTGAAPKSFMDDLGMPLFPALHAVNHILEEEKVRDKLKLLSAGKLISPGKQIMAMSLGADACYTARGFMLALGCIQALQCGKNTCPVGITTHDKGLQKGLNVERKAERVKNYVMNLEKEFKEILSAAGVKSAKELHESNIYVPDPKSLTMCN